MKSANAECGHTCKPRRASPEAHIYGVVLLVKDRAIHCEARLVAARFRSRRDISALFRGTLGVWQLDDAEFAALLPQAQKLSGAVYVRFNTVMTRACPVSDYAGPPPVTDFAIKNQATYVPSWLNLDFKQQQWQGEFGWNASKQGQANTKQLRAAPTASRN